MTDYGKIGRFVAEATGTPVKSAKKGKAAEIKKVKVAPQDKKLLPEMIKNFSDVKAHAKMLDKADGKEDGIIDVGKIAGALTGKSTPNLKITVDEYNKMSLFPPKSSTEKK